MEQLKGLGAEGFEFTISDCPRALRADVRIILRDVDIDALSFVCTCQRARMDLVNISSEVDVEKDLLLERFTQFARHACEALEAKGHWADYADPCSGLLVRNRMSNVIWPEVEAMAQLLKYKTLNAGPCHILLHPRWGSACYPATMFSTAPRPDLIAALSAASGALQTQERPSSGF